VYCAAQFAERHCSQLAVEPPSKLCTRGAPASTSVNGQAPAPELDPLLDPEPLPLELPLDPEPEPAPESEPLPELEPPLDDPLLPPPESALPGPE
jgi:hypothetical protein